MIWYLASTFAMALSGLLIYLYYLKKGQFEDSEDVKFQLFREDK